MTTGNTLRIVLLLSSVALAPSFGIPARAARDKQAASSRAADQRAIERILRDQQEAWNQANLDKFVEGYWHSPELTFSGSSGVHRGWDAVLARYKKNYPDRAAMGQLDFSGLEVRFLGSDAALILGRWHLTRTQGDIGGVFSLVLQRFPEGWRIIHDHTSAVSEDPMQK
jgi:uncharacterized protein (TIGR02246 family)